MVNQPQNLFKPHLAPVYIEIEMNFLFFSKNLPPPENLETRVDAHDFSTMIIDKKQKKNKLELWRKKSQITYANYHMPSEKIA